MADQTFLSMLQDLPSADGVEPDEPIPEGAQDTGAEVPDDLRRLWSLVRQSAAQARELADDENGHEATLRHATWTADIAREIFWRDLRQIISPHLRDMPVIGIATGWRIWVQGQSHDDCDCPGCVLRRALEAGGPIGVVVL